MLSNQQIGNYLEQLGFTLIPPKNPQNYKVLQFKHPNLESSIYVKNANHLPLVIHGNYKRVLSEVLKIPGVSSDPVKVLYFNSNMKDFDKQKNTGQVPEHFGLHFDFDSTAALKEFVSIISNKSIASTVPTITEEPLTAQNQTERDALIKARIGQGKYRAALKSYWNGCAVTGCTVDSLLVSSHIKPWSVDKDARLDVYNGLLLSPTLDLAFDKGLISFDDNGLILLSSILSKDDLQLLNLHPSMRLRKMEDQHRSYLDWHRTHLFRA